MAAPTAMSRYSVCRFVQQNRIVLTIPVTRPQVTRISLDRPHYPRAMATIEEERREEATEIGEEHRTRLLQRRYSREAGRRKRAAETLVSCPDLTSSGYVTIRTCKHTYTYTRTAIDIIKYGAHSGSPQ